MEDMAEWIANAAKELRGVAQALSGKGVKKVPALRRPQDAFGDTEAEAVVLAQNPNQQQQNAELREQLEKVEQILS